MDPHRDDLLSFLFVPPFSSRLVKSSVFTKGGVSENTRTVFEAIFIGKEKSFDGNRFMKRGDVTGSFVDWSSGSPGLVYPTAGYGGSAPRWRRHGSHSAALELRVTDDGWRLTAAKSFC